MVTGSLNHYSSDAFHHLDSDYRVHLAQSLVSVSAYGVHLTQIRSQSQGKAIEANIVPSCHKNRVRQASRSHTDSSFVSCMTNEAWNKNKLTAGLGWVFSDLDLETPIHGSMVVSFISSNLIAETNTIRSTLCMALTLEFSTLKVLSNSLTLIKVIYFRRPPV